MSKTRTIILGASHWHVPLYARAIGEEHQVVGVSDEDVSLVQGLAKAWGAPVAADWRSLLDLPEVGLAYVFGPHDEMAGKCLALIERGIPFVVEKPLGTSLAELVQVRKAADAAGVPGTVPLIQRGGPTDRWLAKSGRPTYQRISFIAGPPSRYLANGNPWMLDAATAGGGCLANLGPNFVDLFLQACGESASSVDSRLSSALHGGAVEDHASLIITTPSGCESHRGGGVRLPGFAAQALLQLHLGGRGGVRLRQLGRFCHVHCVGRDNGVRRDRRGQ
ncbi:MAG TPA: Gfo/Idh/MocA family oxidoreductase [Arthrobacter sp.]|uniref:Gfo/Idh/MocA family protein n=1 Tax=Arthrobacter sp. TaxID=1667 RepID=UPI002F3EB100